MIWSVQHWFYDPTKGISSGPRFETFDRKDAALASVPAGSRYNLFRRNKLILFNEWKY